MADIKRISNKNVIENGNVDSNLSMSDILLCQHVAGDNNDYQVSLAQAQAVPYGTCTSAAGEDKVVNLVNYPSSFTAQVGTKILVKFTNANTKGSVSAGTYPTLTAGGVTKPIAAQGKTIGAGAIVAGQIVELTLTPDYWNIDQDTREVTNSYIIKSDGSNIYTASQVNGALADKKNLKLNEVSYNNADLAIPSADGVEFFNVSYSATNAPLNTMSWVFKSTKRGTGLHQIAFSAENASVDYIYSRTGQTSDGTNWTFLSWVKLATTSDLVSTCEDITSQCSATNDYITINSVKAFKMGTMVTLTCNITSKGNQYGVVKIPQKYTPRSADFEDQWFPYVINGYKCTATINRASEFYIQFESTIPNGVTYRASFTYHI